MNIEIKNCNNIDSAKITITENKLNIKFAHNGTYHIENEFICQLDHTQFDLMPEYVVAECDKKLKEVE